MGARGPIGVAKKGLLSKHKKKKEVKTFLKKVVKYLKSDSFMYSHMLNSTPLEAASLNNLDIGVDIYKPVEEKRCFHENLGEYLRSDDYLYAPLLEMPSYSGPSTSEFPPSGPQWRFRRVGGEAPLRNGSSEAEQKSTEEAGYSPEQDKRSKDRTDVADTTVKKSKYGLPDANGVVRTASIHREITKRVIARNYRTSSNPGKPAVESSWNLLHM